MSLQPPPDGIRVPEGGFTAPRVLTQQESLHSLWAPLAHRCEGEAAGHGREAPCTSFPLAFLLPGCLWGWGETVCCTHTVIVCPSQPPGFPPGALVAPAPARAFMGTVFLGCLGFGFFCLF